MYFDEAPKARRGDLYDFDEQFETFVRWLKEGARFICILGLRRTGKTSLLLTGLNEAKIPYLFIDGRRFSEVPAIPLESLIEEFERALNDLLSREKSLAEKILDFIEEIPGAEAVSKLKIKLARGPTRKEITHLPGIFDALDAFASKKKKKVVVAFDEAQEFRKLRGYEIPKLLAHVYDIKTNVQLVATGSQVGFLRDFLGAGDPKAPLFGRVISEIEVPYLTGEQAHEFLELGFKQVGIKPDPETLEDAVRRLDGITGWLAHVGVVASREGRMDRKILERALDEGARLVAQELENFLLVRPFARKRYISILKMIAESRGARWSSLKIGLEMEERRKVTDKIFSDLLGNLVRSGFLQKTDELYVLRDPLLVHALRGGIVTR